MLLATQYYRPPFPDRSHWDADLRAISEAGLQAIELWAVWAWIEPERGRFVFDDFDELVGKAAKVGLKVIITAVAEMHPYWIHREIPDSRLVDHMGRAVISSTLAYNHQGLSPGGCPDHPSVRALLLRFLTTLGARYTNSPNLMLWDCWNEIRVNVQSDGYVCHCTHTRAAYQVWLKARYGTLERLGKAWHRRFSDWDDVPAAKVPGRSWTDLMEWQQFLQDRTAAMVRFRADGIRAGDPRHPVIAHSVILSPFMIGSESEFDPPESRGNDWQIVDGLDGFGGSHFPGWFHSLPSEYGARVESVRSAAGKLPCWICELQGGGARNGIDVMTPVTAEMQQQWIWGAFGRGMIGICFWCWRDEVFGRESGGFGVVGNDGHASQRIAAIKNTTAVLDHHRELFEHYRPVPAKIGVVFDSLNHQLEWSQYGAASSQSAASVKGYLQCLERLQAPYDVLDAGHLAELSRYRLLLLPWPMIIRQSLADALRTWVVAGGTLMVESECDAYDALGFYRYPADRTFARALGILGAGRRPLPAPPEISVEYEGFAGSLRAATWLEPLTGDHGESIASSSGHCLGVKSDVGRGRVVALGSHVGLAYERARYPDFEEFVQLIAARADALPDLQCSMRDGEVVQYRQGWSGNRMLIFLTNAGAPVEIQLSWNICPQGSCGGTARELLSGATMPVERIDDRFNLRISLRGAGSHVVLID